MKQESEAYVKSVYPDACIYGYPHGKVRIETQPPNKKILSDTFGVGTREFRRSQAWRDAETRLMKLEGSL